MTNKFELYKCKICGNVIEILISGDGNPVCCGEEMEKIEVKNDNLNSPDMTEKHSPKVEYNDNNRVITVEKHPMTEEHHIIFVQAISNDNTELKIKYFKPSEEARMQTDIRDLKARSYCNIHGLYVNK